MPTATPPVGIDFGTAAALPGGRACLPAQLRTSGAQVSGTQNDIGFDAMLFTVSGCAINPAIGAGTSADKELFEASLGVGLERILLVGLNMTPIPDGVLYACTFTASANVAPGNYTVSNAPIATDPQGNPVSNVGGAEGHLIVTTCNGDCDGDGIVTIGEVIKCVGMFLGEAFCDPATPSLSCPVADANVDGIVSIGEVIKCANRFLTDCL